MTDQTQAAQLLLMHTIRHVLFKDAKIRTYYNSPALTTKDDIYLCFTVSEGHPAYQHEYWRIAHAHSMTLDYGELADVFEPIPSAFSDLLRNEYGQVDGLSTVSNTEKFGYKRTTIGMPMNWGYVRKTEYVELFIQEKYYDVFKVVVDLGALTYRFG